MAKDIDLRNMTRTDMEDEVMLLRAKCRVQDNEMYSLREQLAALRGELASLIVSTETSCACCDPPSYGGDIYKDINPQETSLRDMFPSECADRYD